jgi:small-conductance mechanosensitive channel
VGVHYDSDMAQVRDVLTAAATGIPWRSTEHEPQVLLLGFGASSVDWEVSVWTQDPWRSRTDLSLVHEAIWDALKLAGITISYPQVDLHLNRPVIDALGAGPRLVG